MILRWAVCAVAVIALTGCQALSAIDSAAEPTDLYTATPKSTFDLDLPNVYWQLAVEVPVSAASLNTGRVAIQMSPTSTDYYAKVAWTDRAPLMVQTRIVDSFENTRKIVAVARESIALRANYVLQPDLRNFEAMYFYGQPPIVKVRIIAKLVRMPDRQIIGVASFERCVRARADKVPKPSTRRWAASSSGWSHGRFGRRHHGRPAIRRRTTSSVSATRRMPSSTAKAVPRATTPRWFPSPTSRIGAQAPFLTRDQARSASTRARSP